MNPVSDKPRFCYVYILRSKKNNQWYTGCTTDLRKRLKEHNVGKFNSWIKGRGPFELIYYEAYLRPNILYTRTLKALPITNGMKLQELVNTLSNILASGAGEADVKIGDKDIEAVTLTEADGVKTVIVAGVESTPLEATPLTG